MGASAADHKFDSEFTQNPRAPLGVHMDASTALAGTLAAEG